MNLFFLLIGCVPCCAPEPEEVKPKQEKVETDSVRCEPDVRDCYIAPQVVPMWKYRK